MRHGDKHEVGLAWFAETLLKYKRFYVELFALAMFLRLIGLFEPFVLQVIIDRILPFERQESLTVLIIVFGVVSVFMIAFETVTDLLANLTGNRVSREFGLRIFDHLLKLPFSRFRDLDVGEIIARIGEIRTIRSFLVGTTMSVMLDIIFVTIYIAVMLSLSPALSTIVLAAMPLQITVYLVFGPWLRRRLRAEFDAGADYQSRMVECINGAAAFKALSAEKPIASRLNAALGKVLDTNFRVQILSIVSDKILFAIEQATNIAIIYFGALLVFDGQMTLGGLIAFRIIAGRVSAPIADFSSLWEQWQNIRVSRQRLADILLAKPEPFKARPLLPGDIQPKIEFKQVGFSYKETAPAILENFSFTAPPHALTLVIGPSGIGKSTFGRLASGIETPTSGEVLFGGHPISQFEPHDVRRRIAYVPQEPYLFSGTLRENLVFGDRKADDDRLIEALRITGGERLIDTLPGGLDAVIGDRGMTVSGGQRQRIAIARSLLVEPLLIVLDEPTSALDVDAQSTMANQLTQLKTAMTVIVITHAPDRFEQADHIFDFESMI